MGVGYVARFQTKILSANKQNLSVLRQIALPLCILEAHKEELAALLLCLLVAYEEELGGFKQFVGKVNSTSAPLANLMPNIIQKIFVRTALNTYMFFL